MDKLKECKYCGAVQYKEAVECRTCGSPIDAQISADTIKVVINTCYGGFHPSHKAIMRWAELSNIEMHVIVEIERWDIKNNKPARYRELAPDEDVTPFFIIYYCTKPLNPDGTTQDGSHWYYGSMDDERVFRSDPIFVQVVEELGEEAADPSVSELKIVEIPADVKWGIEEYDGVEWIAEEHRTWS